MTESLHTPRTALFQDAPHLRLDSAELEAWERDGFVRLGPILSTEQVELLRTRLESLIARLDELDGELHEVEAAWRERPNEVVLHLLGAWRVDDDFHDLVAHPAVVHRVHDVLAHGRSTPPGLRLWHDQLFLKPARHPGVVPWHADWSYWQRTAPQGHATVFLALDDMDADNGALQYAPGSHRWPTPPAMDFGGPMDQVLEHLSPEQRAAFAPRLQPLRAGEALLHHPGLLHGSGPNRSAGPRRAAVVNYMAAETRSASSEPLLRGAEPVAPGEVVRGTHFPRLV